MNVQLLKELIEKNPRVILPEFGAFLVKDDGTGVFKPDNVSFSPFLRYNDGMVEDALCKLMSISKEEAAKQVKAFIESIKDQLLNSNYFPIEGLGSLRRDNRGSVLFSKKIEESPATVKETEPQPKEKEVKEVETVKKEKTEAKKTPEEKVEAIKEEPKPVKKAVSEEKKEIKKPLPRKTTVQKPVHKIEKPKPQPIVKEKSEATVDESGSGTGKAILIGSAIGLGVIILLLGGWYLVDNGFFIKSGDKEKTPIIANEIVSTETPQPASEASKETENLQNVEGKLDKEFESMSKEMDKVSTEQTSQPEEIKEPSKTAPEITPTAESSEVIPTSDGPFHLIVGSFRNPEYAQKFSDDMKRSGYSSTVVVQQSGMHAVTLGSYSTRQDALRAMEQFKSKHPSVWLLQQ